MWKFFNKTDHWISTYHQLFSLRKLYFQLCIMSTSMFSSPCCSAIISDSRSNDRRLLKHNFFYLCSLTFFLSLSISLLFSVNKHSYCAQQTMATLDPHHQIWPIMCRTHISVTIMIIHHRHCSLFLQFPPSL